MTAKWIKLVSRIQIYQLERFKDTFEHMTEDKDFFNFLDCLKPLLEGPFYYSAIFVCYR